ncbi:MAG: hypothetical protein IKD08_06955 [Alphaproteobacteria bacterium]|nr:hypothetical protein [Alphaproteobacteria bacterium]
MRKKKTHLPVAKITGEEVGIYRGNRDFYIKICREWYRRNLTGTKVNNPILGDINFYSRAFSETVSKIPVNISDLKYLAAVKTILEKSIDIVPESPNHLRKDTIKRFYAVYGYIKIKGAIEKIKVIVAEDREGRKYHCLDARQN